MAYWRLYYHFVWGTKKREHTITSDIENEVYSYLTGKIAHQEAHVFAVGGYRDHIHVVASVHPKVALSNFVHRIKGSTSHHINGLLRPQGRALYFQKGYGVVSFGGKQLQRIMAYVKHQKQHHERNDLFAGLERWDSDNNPPVSFFAD